MTNVVPLRPPADSKPATQAAGPDTPWTYRLMYIENNQTAIVLGENPLNLFSIMKSLSDRRVLATLYLGETAIGGTLIGINGDCIAYMFT